MTGYDEWDLPPKPRHPRPPISPPEESKNKNLWLFDIEDDPEERHDVAHERWDVVRVMLRKLADYNATAVPVIFPNGPDPKGAPSLHNGVWEPWGKLDHKSPRLN